MKRIIKAISYLLLSFVVFYAVLVFLGLPLNIMEWEEAKRAAFLAISMVLAFIIYAVNEGYV